MTTGSWEVGTSYNTDTQTHFRAKKYWQGGDGFLIEDRVSRKKRWNGYQMAHLRYTCPGSNLISLFDKSSHVVYNDVPAVSLGLENSVVSSVFPRAYFNSFWTSSLEYALLAKLLNKVKSHSFNVGVSLAEVDKLAGTVLGTIKTLAFGVDDLARGNFSRFARRFGTSPPTKDVVRRLRVSDIPGRFLEMRYAWQPAIQDVYEASKAFEALSNGPRQQVVKASHRYDTEHPTYGNYLDGVVQLQLQRTYTYEMYEELAAYRQMGLGNPLSIVWERLPWSFVLDWFYPVGSYLELIGQIPFMNGRWMRSDSLRQTQVGWTRLDPSWDPYYELRSSLPLMETLNFYLERSVSFGPPSVPTPDFTVNGALHGKRIQNAVGLASQLFSKYAGLSRFSLPRPGDTSWRGFLSTYEI